MARRYQRHRYGRLQQELALIKRIKNNLLVFDHPEKSPSNARPMPCTRSTGPLVRRMVMYPVLTREGGRVLCVRCNRYAATARNKLPSHAAGLEQAGLKEGEHVYSPAPSLANAPGADPKLPSACAAMYENAA